MLLYTQSHVVKHVPNVINFAFNLMKAYIFMQIFT